MASSRSKGNGSNAQEPRLNWTWPQIHAGIYCAETGLGQCSKQKYEQKKKL